MTWERKLKLKGKQLRTVQVKIEAIREMIETCQQETFLKESSFALLEQAKAQCEALQRIVGWA